ncbi:c-type cytochrome [Chelativorans salis]|uniref:Cytochrome c family protein n=1 Tax=Chelativorans salis TaxID=2978478 RepID=A0ABT2LL62_9HYPH|nr:cytochrome c family protein [Chelativorans sp. EGI FJ00035]MCT7374398.1 cytochrome c family protein [Chelativorans sp. EGI FJ00035]
MDSFELNKIIGALLGVVFVIFSVSLLSETFFHSPAPETPGYAIVVPEGEGPAEGDGEQAPESVLPLLADADPSAGEAVFKRCQACHTVEEGGPNKVGPNLWGVVNRPVASHEGFSYSAGMQEYAQGGEVVWDYENLDHFLASPKAEVSGTAMAFAGLKNVEDRANVIAYLRTLSNDPAPLPEAPAEGEGEAEDDSQATGDGQEAAPAEGGAQAAPMEDSAEEAPAEQQEAETEEGADGGEAAAPAEEEQPAATEQ